MMHDPRRYALLQRLKRVRAIERRTALDELARARAEQQHLSGLAHRSQALARDYAGRREAGMAGDLQGLFAVRTHLADLAEAAGRLGDDAARSAELAADRLQSAERRLELVGERIEAGRAQRQSQASRSVGPASPRMARGLQRSGGETRRSSRGSTP